MGLPNSRKVSVAVRSRPERLAADIKLNIAKEALEGKIGISSLASKYGVARKTVYQWIARYQKAVEKGLVGARALEENYKKGKEHPRAVYPKIQEDILRLVVQSPEFSVRQLAELVPASSWTVWSILSRNHLNLYPQRLFYATRQREPKVIRFAFWFKGIRSVFETFVPQIAPTPPPLKPFLASLISSSVLSLLFLFWLSIFAHQPLGVQIGLFFATIALLVGTFFFIYSMKYYFTLALVLSFSTQSLEAGVSGELREKGLKGWLAKIFGLNGKGGPPSFASGETSARQAGGLQPNLDHVKLERFPFISIHLPFYNEAKVANRIISACTSFDYENYEVIVCDDSTDETARIVKEWEKTFGPSSGRGHPQVKVLHRPTREGFKGGALKYALAAMDPRTEFVIVFDADFVPYPDTLTQFMKYFKATGGWSENLSYQGATIQTMPYSTNGEVPQESQVPQVSQAFYSRGTRDTSPSRDTFLRQEQAILAKNPIAVVAGYQWHVLNKSENWITRGVRTEYAGSYVIERPGQEILGAMKIIHGSVYCMRADVLKHFGWGTSITEDFELTLRIYEKGFKVVYTPYVQAPSECISTIKRLIRQRMRWAEGHSFNVRKMFGRLLLGSFQRSDLKLGRTSPEKVWQPSPLTLTEKFEFLYISPYYLQAFFFLLGTFSWLLSETVFGTRLPFWTSLWGWSLVLTNFFALPLMNAVGLFLEESEEKDYMGLFSFIALCYIVTPFQAYAAIKGFIEPREGPWFRTPKTGKITDIFTRGRFYRWVSGILPGRRPVFAGASAGKPALILNPYLALATANNQFENFRIKPKRIKWLGRTFLAILLLLSTTILSLAPAVPYFIKPQETQAKAFGTILGSKSVASSFGKSKSFPIQSFQQGENTNTSWVKKFVFDHPEYASLPVFKRDRYGIHFQKPDGTIEANFTEKPIHYQDENDQWQPINTALKQNGDEITGSGTLVKIKTDGTVLINNQDYAHKTSGYGWYNPETQIFNPIQDLPAGEIEENKFVRKAKDFRHELIMLDTGLKEEMTLYEKPREGQDGDYLVIQTTIKGLDFPDGELGEYVYQGLTFPSPKCSDAEGKDIPCKRFAKKDNNTQYIYTGIPVTRLATAEYPVTIDPDFVGSTADGVVWGLNGTKATARGTANYIDVTGTSMRMETDYIDFLYQYNRGFLKFDTSTIGAGSTVTQVNLKMTPTYKLLTAGYDYNIQVVKYDWSASDPITTTNKDTVFDGNLAATLDDNIWQAISGVSINTQYSSGNLNTAWVIKDGTTYYGLRTSTDSSNASLTNNKYLILDIATQEHATSAYRPVLTVTYLPSSPDTSTSASATAYSFQRKTWYDGARLWSAFYSGSEIQFWYSVDWGSSWIQNTSATISVSTNDFTIEADTTDAFIAYTDGYDIKANEDTGTYPATDFAWGASPTTVYDGNSGTDEFDYPAITKDSNSKVWITATHLSGTDYLFKARQGTTANDISTWGTASTLDTSANSNKYGTIVSLGSGNMYATWIDGTTIEGKKYASYTVDKQVAAGADDGYRCTGTRGFNATEYNIIVGYWNDASMYHCHGFARWTGVTYEGTVGANSYIQQYGYGNPQGTPQLKVYVIDEADPPAPTTAAEFDLDPLTVGADWDGAWAPNAWVQSSSLAVPLQEYVDTFGPIVNKALMMQVKNDGGTTSRYNTGTCYEYSSHTLGPKLHIEYTAWDSSATTIAIGVTGLTNNMSAVSDSSGNVHLLYIDSNDYAVYQKYTTSWQTAVTLDGTAGNDYATISLNTSNNDLYALWIRSNVIYYKKGVSPYASANWDASATSWKSSGTNTYVTSNYSGAGMIFATWTEGTDPYSVMWDYIIIPERIWMLLGLGLIIPRLLRRRKNGTKKNI